MAAVRPAAAGSALRTDATAGPGIFFEGYEVYVVDQVGRGRPAYIVDVYGPSRMQTREYSMQRFSTSKKYNLWPQAKLYTQWPGNAQPGDALVEIEVRPHRIFTRKGDDIHVDLPISLNEAVLGGKVKVPTPSGPVTMMVPKWANTGTVLRLRGKGVLRIDGSRGDEFVTLKVMLPEKPDPELEKFVAQWHGAYSPRQAMEA